MRKIKEMLRLRFEQGLGVRQIARSLSVSHCTVSDLLGRTEVAGLAWPLPGGLEEAALEALFRRRWRFSLGKGVGSGPAGVQGMPQVLEECSQI